ncbi:MAG: hypothetical protein QNJ44_01275 [Rhodobacter sp.]|nr:hypothetical protein [Rhodobacter sp.]
MFETHRRHGLAPNPLYSMGAGRVGCRPYVFARKAELRQVFARFPDVVEKLERWEALVGPSSRRGWSSFFTADKIPPPGGVVIDGFIPTPVEVVEWTLTSRGGRQRDLVALTDDTAGCSSENGLCE